MQYLIIPGVMKCGTSSLFDCLAAHSRICPARTKEPEYFSRTQSHGERGAAYNELFDYDPAVHSLLMDGSTGYSKPGEEDVPERIRASGIDPMIVFVLRNPFDRIVSHLNHRRMFHDDARLSHYLIEMSAYWPAIDRFAQAFDRLCVTTLEALVETPAEIARIQAFLGLAPEPLVFRHRNPGTYEAGQRVLSTGERDDIRTRLAPDMARLRSDFGVDVARWGFDG